MKKKLIIGLAIGVGLFFGAGAAMAFWGHGGRGMNPEWRHQVIVERLTKELNLTEKQVAEVEKIQEKILANRPAIFKDELKAHEDFIESLAKPKLNTKALLDEMDQRHKGMLEHRQFLLDRLEEFHGLLSEAQRFKLKELLKKGDLPFFGMGMMHGPGHGWRGHGWHGHHMMRRGMMGPDGMGPGPRGMGKGPGPGQGMGYGPCGWGDPSSEAPAADSSKPATGK